MVELFLGTGVGTRAYSHHRAGPGRAHRLRQARGPPAPSSRRRRRHEVQVAPQGRRAEDGGHRGQPPARGRPRRRAREAARLARPPGEEGREVPLAQGARSGRSSCTRPATGCSGSRGAEAASRTRIAALGETEQAALRRVRALEDEVEARRARLEADGQRLQTLADEVHALDSQTRETEQALAFWRADLATAEAAEAAAAAEGEAAGRPARGARRPAQAALEAELAALGGASAGRRGGDAPRPGGARRRAGAPARGPGAAGAGAARAARSRRPHRQPGDAAQPPGRPARRSSGSGTGRPPPSCSRVRGQESALDRERNEVTRRVQQSRQLTLELAERRGAEEDALQRARAAFAESEVAVISLREELADRRSRLALAGGDPAPLRGLRPRRAGGHAARRDRGARAGHLRPGRRRARAPRRASSGPSRRRSGRGSRTCWWRAARWGSSCRATWPRWPRGAARSSRCRSWRSRRAAAAARAGWPGVLAPGRRRGPRRARVPAGGRAAPGQRAHRRGPRRGAARSATSRPASPR